MATKTKKEKERQLRIEAQGKKNASIASNYTKNLKNAQEDAAAIQFAKEQGIRSAGKNDFIANTAAKEIQQIKKQGAIADALLKKNTTRKTLNENTSVIKNPVIGNYQQKATPMGMETGSALTQESALTRIRQNVQDIQAMKTRKNTENLSEKTDLQPTQQKTQTTGPVGMSVSQALAGAKPKTESTRPKINAISGAAKTNVGNPQKTQETQPQTTAPMQNKGTLYAPKNPGAGGGVVQQMGYAADMQKTKDNALLMGYNRPEWKDVTGSAQYARDLQKAGYYDDTDDYTKWTDGKLKTEYTAEKVKEEAYLSELAKDPQGTMKAWNDKLYNLTNEQKKYEKIAAEGIEDPMRGGTITRRPDDYDTWQYLGNSGEATYMPSYYDSLIYDAIHGENAYADLYENGTDEEIDQAEIEIEDLWDRLENGGFMEMAEDPELVNAIAETRALTDRRGMSKRRKELEDEISRRDVITEMKARAAKLSHKDTQAFKSVVQPENTSGLQERTPEEMAKAATELGTRFFVETAFNGDSTDKSYYYATQDPMVLKYNPYVAEPEHFMTPEEKETFTLLYENDMKAEAQAFLDAIRTDLTERRREFLQQTNIENASGEWGAVYGAGTVVENLLHGPEGTLNSIKALLGDERAKDKNDPSWDAQHYVQEVRGIRSEKWTEAVQGAVTNLGELFGVDKKTVQAAAEKIGQIGGFANQVMYSMLDNAAAYLTTMGVGSSLNFDMTSKFAEGMMQFIMSSEATASTMAEQLDNGKQPWEAAVMAIGSGLIEAATEKWSFEAFMDMDAEKIMKGVQEAWKYIAKNFVAEGSEELTGFLGEQLMDQIVSTLAGHKSEIQARFEELGGDNEAFKKVMWEYAGKAATDFLAGGAAGAGQSSLNVARYGVQSYITGKNVSHAEANSLGENGPSQLIKTALGMKEDTESHKMAQGIQARIDAGKNVSNFELGNLGNMLYKESGGSMVQAAAVDIVKKQAQEELKALGMKDPQMTADAIAKQVVTGEVSKAEHMLISNSGAALQVLKSFMTNPEKLNEAVKAGVKEAGSVRQAIQNVVSGKAKSSAAEGLVNRAYRNASIADKATAAMAKGKRTGATDAVRDGQVVQIKNIKFDTKQETDADGNKSILDDSTVTIQTENGEETVSLGDIQAMDRDTGALLEFVKTNKGIISEQFANTVLNQIAQGKGKQKAGNILDSAMKIRLAAYTDSAMPRTDLDSETAEALWSEAQKEYEAEEKQRTEVRTTIKENQGSLTFEGAEFGTKRWEETLKRSGLNKGQRDEANTLGEIAKRLGFKVNLINDTENDAIFGWEDRNTGTVTINLAGKDENGRSHSILTAAAHEFTHWIEQNSPNEYAKLRGYVIEQLKSQGKDVTSMLMDKVANYELYDQDINLSGAMAEMVADACDGIFSSQEMANKLQEINPTLFGKMKEFVSNWIAKVRAVINNMKASASYESRALEKQVDEIARIWLGAREEAMNGEATPAAEAQEEETQKSVRQRDTEYREAIENGDVIKASSMLREEAEKAGYTVFGTHRTNANFTVFEKSKQTGKNGKSLGDGFYIASGLNTEYDSDIYGKNRMLVYVKPGKVFNITNGLTKQQANKVYEKYFAPFHEDKYNTYRPHVIEKLQSGTRLIDYIKEAAETNNTTTDEIFKWLGYNSIKDGPQYVVFDPEQIKSANLETKDDSGKVIELSERFNKKNPDIRYSARKNQKTVEGASRIPMVDDIDNMGGSIATRKTGNTTNNPDVPSTGISINENIQSVNSDKAYIDAVESGDLKTATDMLMDKLNKTEGIIPFMSNNWDTGMARKIARLIKNPQMTEEIAYAAADMARNVPENAVLIPMPDRTGKVTDKTNTAVLAKAIGELTGRPVVYAIEGVEHESRSEAKKQNKLGVSQEELGFRKVAEIPEGTIPIFIDNIVGKGITADAARKAMGGGITLAYTKTLRSPGIIGLKNAVITRDSKGNIIPLSQRFDVSKRDVRYSARQRDQAYMEAAEAGKMETAQRMVDEAAKAAGYTDVVYHGTDEFGFTEFDLIKGKGAIFVSYSPEIALSYTKPNGQIKNITDKEGKNGVYKLYEKPGKQLVIDAEYQPFSAVKHDSLMRGITDSVISPSWMEMEEVITGQRAYDTNEIARIAKELGYDSVRIKNVYDYGGKNYKVDAKNGYGDIGIIFNPNDVKSADPIVYDDEGNIIPLSERFNPEKKDIRYSVKQGEQPQDIRNDEGEPVATILPGNTIAETQFSLRSYYDDDERGKMIKAMKKAGYTKEQAENWMKSLDNIAKIMIADRMRYDFTADRSKTFLKENGDVYKKTLDASTMCKKTRLYNGTFNLVQHMLPNTILMPEDLIDLYNMMKEMDLETPCGMCYVQSRRRLLGPYTEEWLKEYKGEYIPTVDEVTTSDGLEKLKKEHPQAYTDFVDAMNSKGVNNPKLVQQRTDYRGDIRNLRQSTIDYLNKIGGLRIQSFSDFEVVHMLDLMQAVMDMKAKGLSAQAYTKVPEFAKIYGPTGIKINVSVLGSGVGVDHHGNLIMDNDEGMNWDTARELREMYPEDVGTVIVGINDEHIIAAMGNGEIDFIIPFHKSGWSKAELEKMKTLKHYKDYTDYQNEYMIQGKDADGKLITKKAESNIDPLSYWKFELSGEENAKIYLAECAKQKLVPKFSNFLVDNGDGTFSLPQGKDQRSTNIREGYWKTLIDFKMYENDAYGRTLKDGTKTKVKGAPQKKVQPNFNMDAAMEILENYDGSHRTLPESEEAAKKFVKEYKKNHPLDDVRKQYSIRSPESHDVERWMAALNADSLESEAEKKLLREFQGLKMQQDLNQLKQTELKNEINKIEALRKAPELTDEEKSMLADLKKRYDKTHHLPAAEYRMMKMLQKKTQSREATAEEKSTLSRLRNLLINAQKKGEAIAEQMYDVTGAEGFASMMYRQHKFIDDEIGDKTREELHETVEKMNQEAEEIRKELEKTTVELARLEGNAAVQNVKNALKKGRLREMAKVLKSAYGTNMSYNELEAALAEIKLKAVNGERYDAEIEKLAQRIAETIKYGENETLRALRGLTITIGPGQQAELKGQNSNLNEIRKRLAGTGIKVVRGNYSTLEKDASDLHEQFTDMPDLGDEKDSLENFVRWVEGLKRNNNAAQQFGLDMDELRAVVKASALNLQFTEETQATRDELLSAIKELKTNTAKAIERIKSLNRNVEQMIRSGKQAQGLSGVLQSDVAMTINYYNRIAKLAQETAKEKTLRETIIQLKSEAAEAIAKSNEEWRALIERDRQARNTAEDIGAARGRINTAIKRLYKLMSEPKGLKNVPEHMQGLARELIGIIVDNDLSEDGRKLSKADKEQLIAAKMKLDAWNARDGEFNLADLSGDDDIPLAIINDDLKTIYDAIEQWNKPIRGKNKADTLQQRKEIIVRMQEAISEVYGYIRQGQMINIRDRQIAVEDAAEAVREGTQGKKFREKTGRIGRTMAAMHKGIVSGNMTPEYFFRMLGNKGLSELWEGYHEAENRNGLELKKAQDKLAEIAEKHGFKNWDMKQKVTLKMDNGDSVEMTVGQLMSLYATWKREQTIGPENSFHLTRGGFYAEQDLRDGWLGSTVVEKKAHRMTESDAATVENLLTDEQRAFVDDVVEFMSDDMSKIGNEASMKAYGIKMYKESYYFPFKIWDGVKNRKSNDAGGAAAAQDRAFHQSFTKARMNNASNALLIGDFMQTAADHIAGMINYATMGLANENLQKVLNQKVTEGVGEDATQRNTQAILDEAYGAEAMAYLNNLKQQLNGGAYKVEKTFYDKLISVFRKNAVAGSLSVAFQQPLSYLRAAMMISPKYLAQGVGREYWSGAYKEMLNHSGVAVIKDMGRFDMNFGQSAREYLTPDGKKSMAKAAWDQITDKATILPEKMDAWTWTRMWVAVKAEQKAMHPEMDVKSDEFLNLCGERFNDIMRRTQVYDSVLVKSQNMRSQNPIMKSITSFMAEPTLTANVLMDSLRMAKNGEASGKAMLAKAGAIFILSAAMQAAVKAAFSSGRSPDDKKTWLENFMNRFGSNMISEMDPMQLIPGYSDIVTLLKGGTLDDDAYNMVSKLITAGETGIDYLLGNSKKDAYRAFEDSVGQIVQLFSKLPAKNLMRDARAMYNWVTGVNYADRESSAAVIGEQWKENFYNADNLLGVINKRLGDAGYQSGNKAYYERIYQARKAGDTETEKQMTEYLTNAKGVSTETIQSKLSGIAKDDDSLSVTEKAEFMAENGSTTADDYVREQLRNGRITADEARKALRKADPTISEESAWWTVDRIEYQKEKGLEKAPSGQYYRLYDAMDANVSSEIKSVISLMTRHGMKATNIKSQINKKYREAYLAADNRGKVAIRDAMNKAYKALGYTAEDVSKTIQGWTKKK